MDQEPSEEFDHFLCIELGWRSVNQMRREMLAEEWLRWSVYYARKAQRAELARLQAE